MYVLCVICNTKCTCTCSVHVPFTLKKTEHGTSYVIIDVRLNKRPFNTKCRCKTIVCVLTRNADFNN